MEEKVACRVWVLRSMRSMVAIFSDSLTTFAARSQIPKRAAALPLAPVSVCSEPAVAAAPDGAGGPAEAEFAEAASPGRARCSRKKTW